MPTTAARLVEESSSRTRRLVGKSGRRGTPDWMPTEHRLVSWEIVKNPTFSEADVSSISGKRLSTIASSKTTFFGMVGFWDEDAMVLAVVVVFVVVFKK
jgi:hypothetical protein